ncbi:reverse transcriptase domain-containing protein [Tanacetum coccineum]
MAGPKPITPSNEGTLNQNNKNIIEGHISALKELLKEPNNRNLIKPMLLDFEDSHDVSDDEVQDNGKGKPKMDEEDLSKPFKEILKCPFTRRIVEFSSPGHRMPTNVKTYDGTGDPEDHIGRFVGAGNQGEWPMPVWFGMLQACDKDLTLISKLTRKANETLAHFKERWVSESNAIPNVPELMQVSSFMSSHKCPELAKRFSDSIPKTVDEMLKRVDDYLRSEEAYRNTELPRGEFQRRDTPVQWVQRNDRSQRFPHGNNRRRSEHRFVARMPDRHAPYMAPQRPNQELHRPRAVLTLDSLSITPQEILATEHQLNLPQPAPLVGAPSKENLNRQRGKGNQRNNGPQKAKVINMVQSHPLDRKRKTTMRDEEWMNVPITFPPVPARDLSEEPLVVEAEVEGYLVRRIHIDEGASIEIMFEHCFNMLHPAIQARLVETQTTVSEFSGEQVKPLGKIELDVCFGGNGRCRRAIMKFTVIPAPSPYNIILGRPGLRQLRAIPSTIHGIMKFPTPWGVATIVSQATMVLQCGSERKKQAGELPEEVKVLNDTSPTEHVLINPAYPEQLVVIGKNLSPKGLA